MYMNSISRFGGRFLVGFLPVGLSLLLFYRRLSYGYVNSLAIHYFNCFHLDMILPAMRDDCCVLLPLDP